MRPSLFKLLAPLSACLLVLAAPAFAASDGAADSKDDWHRLVGILQYLEADYPFALASGSQFEIDEQNAFIDEAVLAAKALGPEGAQFVAPLEDVRTRIRAKQDPEGVSRDVGKVIAGLIQTGDLKQSPRSPPDLARAKALFQTSCATCHGADGSGQSPIAHTMEPRPANFLDKGLMSQTTAYKQFNTISFGVKGTAMAAFDMLSEEDRWSLAFYTLSLRHPPCEVPTPVLPLDALATATDQDLLKTFTPAQLACLRKRPPAPNEGDVLALARQKVTESMTLAKGGDKAGAKAALLDAYLNGVEPVEPRLAARSADLVQKIEGRVLAMRVAINQGENDRVQAEGQALLGLLEQAGQSGQKTTFWSVLGMAFLILLREGFEALVVVAALLAVLKKVGATGQVKVVHAGWIAALVAGAVAFAFGQKLLAGANREWVEGLVALAAVGMLLYAALWLNARANMSAFMKDLRGQVQGALKSGSAVGLFAISFSAVGRETFETALFLQGLSIDSPSGAVWGAALGALTLAGLVVFVMRVGFRLPMKTLFTASTWLLFGTAVVLLGKGLHALQEVGALPLRPVPFLEVDFLGLYPDLVSLLPQVALALAPVAFWLFRRGRDVDGGAPRPAVEAD